MSNRKSDIQKVEIQLPFPKVSANNLFAGKSARHKVKAYNAWIKQAGLEILIQRPHRFQDCVTVYIDLFRPDDQRRDCDNYLKPILDLLVLHKIVEDDSWRCVRRASIGWAGLDRDKPCAIVTLETCRGG